jgi:hypothetical protein
MPVGDNRGVASTKWQHTPYAYQQLPITPVPAVRCTRAKKGHTGVSREHSSGERVGRGSISKAGSAPAPNLWIERSSDAGRRPHQATGMDQQAIRRAAVITLRR